MTAGTIGVPIIAVSSSLTFGTHFVISLLNGRIDPMILAAASHIHSEWSYDAKWPLDRLAIAFSRRNYRVLLMAEHQNGFTEERRLAYYEACHAASTEHIMLFPGIEYSDKSNTIHILVWGDVSLLQEPFEVIELLEHIAANGGVAIMAHPSRRNAWQQYDDSWTKLLSGIELWNRKTDGWAPSQPAAELLLRTGLFPYVSLDFHTRRQFFPLALELDIPHPPSQASVLAALKSASLRTRLMGRTLAKPLELGQLRWLCFVEQVRRQAAGFLRRHFPA